MIKKPPLYLCTMLLFCFLHACSQDEGTHENPLEPSDDLVPGTPQLFDPGESIISGDSFTLEWTPAEYAESYIIEESTNAKLLGVKRSYTALGTRRTITKNIVYTDTLYYRVKAVNGTARSPDWSNVADLIVYSKKPKLVGPEFRVMSGYTFTLSWTDTGDSLFVLEEANSVDFSEVEIHQCTSLSQTFSYIVEHEITKFYRVKPISEVYEGEWSDTILITLYNPLEENNFTMVSIPPGSFEMGSNLDDSKPVHTVTLSEFKMSRTEVTQQLYKTLMNENPSLDTSHSGLPVYNTGWYNAVRFCNILSKIEGFDLCYNETTWECDFSKNGFRLPTEAEWEYACRAGTTTNYASGDSLEDLDKIGWFEHNSRIDEYSNQRVHKVALKEPNAWGLFDMHGNVLEWCNDWYGDYSGESQTNPTGPENGMQRVKRGGCIVMSFECRSDYRLNQLPVNSWDGLTGIRTVSR